ncbi:MAG: hypothetical protein ABR913_02575 [Sedimentisphaerales bacterium]
MKKYIAILLMCVAAGTVKGATPDIVFDAAQTSHQLMGFGAQVWEGDTRVESMLTSLNMKYVRMKFGGAWNPPAGATQTQMDAYVASQYDGDSSIRTTYGILNPLGINVIANQFEGPASWLDSSNHLKNSNFADMARMWGSIAYYMQNNNMPISYIELFNEPEGTWDIYVSGTDYNTIAKLLRAELDSRGLTSVKICGPGLAYLYDAPSWFNALDATGVTAIGAWSTHAWDEGWGHTDALPSFLDSRYKTYFDPYVLAKDPSRSKPVIITEYATGVLTYNGMTFTDSNVADSNQFAERSYENTLTLLNDGANILSYWEAADEDWMSSGMYGLKRRQGLGSTLRPVYYAMSTLMPLIPDGASVLTKTWNDANISAAGFIGTDRFVVAFANSTAATVSKTIKITGVLTFDIIEAKAFINGSVVDELADLHFDYATSTFDITLPRESTLTVVASVNECSSRLTGDLNGDCKVTFADFAVVASDWLKDNRGPAANVVENFEGFADSNALQASWVPTASTTTLTLDTMTVHGGTKAMKYSYNTGNSPWFAKAEHWLPGGQSGVDWTGYDTLSLWFKCTVSKEPLQVNIVNRYGVNILYAQYGIPQVGDWTRWNIDLTPIAASELQQIGRVDIFFTGQNYGPGTAYFDDITVYDKDSVSCQGSLNGDVNQDCVVDLNDILVISEHWLDCTLVQQADCWQ